ncbi:hypothetical protein EVAR_13164_1 [Eumeta japonica]|uniref:Uncharacterized protein n=1 Tax=Eumeta variegata TaxID=151549 RepID=A0A4C1U9M9_EUMVA|nr:hypothetical protein EVAR_13164_1 [Eumeta japonica]
MATFRIRSKAGAPTAVIPNEKKIAIRSRRRHVRYGDDVICRYCALTISELYRRPSDSGSTISAVNLNHGSIRVQNTGRAGARAPAGAIEIPKTAALRILTGTPPINIRTRSGIDARSSVTFH